MKQIACAIVLAILFGGCSATSITVGGVEGVIFSASHANNFVGVETGQKELTYWTPSRSDVAGAFPRIQAFLKHEAPSIAGRLSQYRCQYFGIIVEGRKRIYCNFFHRDGGIANWKSESLFVCDGGDWYFQLEYDLESEKCLNLRINGEA
ncbi:MAG: hypothetical protein WBD63_07540 [Phycisphaerae bacterium]|nr:hypothetical protein [Phycisphaerae bacterium]